ncbi:RND family transporter [Mycobacterium sp. CBMA247]|nr:RND family transporter [Mycolicibacterium sp. CBMA 329]MUL88334.1 RND family transporter [Mycolicibacterium sp. CBMA 331]MUL99217.1 RND family transporter [Mycolicibacterium sp. CBMA 334]MUM27558.1 RND family transporter [Mycolicibacterium sp. CBMA 295]MUM39981.1 RND family transporter [Mycolicibacterium sp. CBMA 247]MUM44399.1 RND family transporter [Mycolicibacterium sp. CBMA 294]
MHGTADNPESGTFHWLGGVVVRWPWLVIGFWVVLAAALPPLFPSLAELAQKTPPAMLPPDAPGSVAAQHMSEAFHESGSDNILLVVLSDENGLEGSDENVYRSLVDKLRADTASVVTMQDFITTPPLRQVMTSQDGKAWLLPVSLTGELGSPQSYTATSNVVGIVKDTVGGSGITAHVTGPAATLADLAEVGESDRLHIEIATVGMLLAILIMIYRNPLTMILPLLTIGVSLATAQGVVAALGSLGLAISSQTIVFLTAMLAGTGTDYAVFLISRYHDFLRLGQRSDEAVRSALNSIGKVIVASAATVAVTFIGMIFTKLTIFSSVGVALAVAIAIGCIAAMTFLPAVLTLAGRRGWVSPRRSLTDTVWRRSGVRIVRNPRRNLIASLMLLVVLASCAGLAKYNYDDRKALPGSVESLQGYDAIAAHFPVNSSLPQYLLIESPNDLRGPKELADLEQMAHRISQLPNIEAVRGITRPTGESLEQARVSFQAGEVGSKLNDASSLVSERGGDMDKLADGAGQIADALGGVRGQLGQAALTVSGLIDALSSMQKQFGGDKALNQFDSAAKLVVAMRSLGDSIGVTLDDAADSVQQARPVLTALNASPICDGDPSCRNSRGQLQRLVDAGDNGTLAGISQLARKLKATEGNQTLGATTDNLRGAFDTATKALNSAGLDNPSSMRQQLATLQQHADTLADASRQVADGVSLLVNETKRMGGGLGDASAFLLAMKNEARTPSMSGFYVPPQFLATDDFKKAAALFFSADGHTVRYMIQTKLNPFSTDAMDQINAVLDVARDAQPNTTLADAKVSMTGYSVSLRDTRDYYNQDIRFIILVTIAVVFLILVILLRALVAPLYLIASVVISYLSALGIGVVLFQLILGQELHWSVPGLTFIILVAVGADYNLLLISRIREESPHGLRTAVIRTVGATGGVITAAGLIFTASMFGMLFASISTLVQAGFIIGVGILLDTFLVRTTTVPAIAVLVGKFNWWPSRWQPETKARPKKVENIEPEQELATVAD